MYISQAADLRVCLHAILTQSYRYVVTKAPREKRYSIRVNIFACSNCSQSAMEISQLCTKRFNYRKRDAELCLKRLKLETSLFKHVSFCAASPEGKACSKIALKWGRGPPKKGPLSFSPHNLYFDKAGRIEYLYMGLCAVVSPQLQSGNA